MRGQAGISSSSIPIDGARQVPINVDDFKWPEAGPSDPAKRQAKVGPFGAKAVAAITGAVTTSLLSEYCHSSNVSLLGFLAREETYELLISSK